MKNNIKILSAVILLLLSSMILFSACKEKDAEEITTQSNAETTQKIQATDYTYKPIVVATDIYETEYVHTVPPVPTFENRTKIESDTNKSTVKKSDTSTKKYTSKENAEEINQGLLLITKTSPVVKDNSATIIIQGTPGAKYTIDFYKNNTEKAKYEGLDEISADSSGFASWTFKIESDCEPGERKLVIKEKNSDKYIQTTITVQ